MGNGCERRPKIFSRVSTCKGGNFRLIQYLSPRKLLFLSAHEKNHALFRVKSLNLILLGVKWATNTGYFPIRGSKPVISPLRRTGEGSRMQSATHVKTVFSSFLCSGNLCEIRSDGEGAPGDANALSFFSFFRTAAMTVRRRRKRRESPAEEEENMMPNSAREKEKNKRNELQVLCRKPSQLFSLLLPPPQI